MKKQSKKYVTVLVLLLLLMGVTIGYSALSTGLNITGTSKITNATWNIHFADTITPTSGSVTPTTAPTLDTNKTKITYAADLAKPGDFYEFTATVVNEGSIDAKLGALPTVEGVSAAQDVYVNYTFTHSDGTAVASGETIAAGQSKAYKVRVEFDRNITASQLPSAAQNLTLTVDMNWVQA